MSHESESHLTFDCSCAIIAPAIVVASHFRLAQSGNLLTACCVRCERVASRSFVVIAVIVDIIFGLLFDYRQAS